MSLEVEYMRQQRWDDALEILRAARDESSDGTPSPEIRRMRDLNIELAEKAREIPRKESTAR